MEGTTQNRINPQCIACSKLNLQKRFVDIEGKKEIGFNPYARKLPSCYTPKCRRKRSYYRNWEENKQRMLDRHRYLKHKGDRCSLCGSTDSIQVHHIIPQCKGGMDAEFNLITLCYACHKTITAYHQTIGYI